MSTPKKVRACYDNIFQRYINTSAATKRIRQFLTEFNKQQPFQLPITLADVSAHFFPEMKAPKKAAKPRKAAVSKRKSSKTVAKKKTAAKGVTRRRVKKAG